MTLSQRPQYHRALPTILKPSTCFRNPLLSESRFITRSYHPVTERQRGERWASTTPPPQRSVGRPVRCNAGQAGRRKTLVASSCLSQGFTVRRLSYVCCHMSPRSLQNGARRRCKVPSQFTFWELHRHFTYENSTCRDTIPLQNSEPHIRSTQRHTPGPRGKPPRCQVRHDRGSQARGGRGVR